MKSFFKILFLAIGFLLWSCSQSQISDPSFNETSHQSNLTKGSVGSIGDLLGDCPDIYYESTKTLKNGAVVTWTSSFGGFDYTMGSPYTVTVTWSVENGSAQFLDFKAKKKVWTPPRDVEGNWLFDDATNELTVTMTQMHRSVQPGWQGYIGNGHFKLELNVTNASGTVKAKLGVNVHLEDPDPGYPDRCPQ